MNRVKLTSHNRSKTSNSGTVSKSLNRHQVPADVSTPSLTNDDNKNNNNASTSSSGQTSRENSHRHARSITRSPTPIKYDYDIYLKRSPTFGRRCPVLNRRLRRSSDRDSSANEDQPTSSINEDHYSTANKSQDTSHDTPIVSSSISRVYRGHKGNNNNFKSSSSSFTTSYFQHDDRESHSRSRRLNTSHKRKQRKSPARWQHDLFDDDGPSSKKLVTYNSDKE